MNVTYHDDAVRAAFLIVRHAVHQWDGPTRKAVITARAEIDVIGRLLGIEPLYDGAPKPTAAELEATKPCDCMADATCTVTVLAPGVDDPVQSVWRPMEDAPKDGRPLLLNYWSPRQDPIVARWCEETVAGWLPTGYKMLLLSDRDLSGWTPLPGAEAPQPAPLNVISADDAAEILRKNPGGNLVSHGVAIGDVRKEGAVCWTVGDVLMCRQLPDSDNMSAGFVLLDTGRMEHGWWHQYWGYWVFVGEDDMMIGQDGFSVPVESGEAQALSDLIALKVRASDGG